MKSAAQNCASVRNRVLVAAVLATSMAFIDAMALVLALPSIQREFGADALQLMWINVAYAVPLTAFLLLGGALGDRFGRKRIFMTGIIVFAAAALACGLAPGVRSLICLRAVQGAGAALMIPGSLALITRTYPEELRGRAIGAWSGLTVIATIGGPVIGGFLADAGLWRWIFFINLPVSVAALALLRSSVPSRSHQKPRLRSDWTGALLATCSLGATSFALIEAPRHGIGDARTLVTLGAGVIALGAFLLWESRSRNPLVAPGLFRSRELRAAALLTLLLYSAWNALLFFLPLNLIQVQGYSPAAAGLAQLPLMLALAILSPAAGKLADRKGVRLPLVLGPAIAGAGFLLLAVPGLTAGVSEFWTRFFPGLLVLGAGLGLTVAPLSTAIMDSVPGDDSGLASGINSTLARLAGLAGIALLGPLVILSSHSALATFESVPEPREILGSVTFPGKIGSNGMGQREIDLALESKPAFIHAFRFLCLLSAGLCWAGLFVVLRGFQRTQAGITAASPDIATT